ncbi:MAG TPA: hypothetical protein VGA36_00775, partial [Nitriliruptorales bacterium]
MKSAAPQLAAATRPSRTVNGRPDQDGELRPPERGDATGWSRRVLVVIAAGRQAGVQDGANVVAART